ncbi:MAG: type I methionyl aminopeptidase [Micrococcales bacterium]|nr:type I methionyl aminopeptidase [Micrococcales bacterium]NBR55060.1 type I methionyl aminopeptidase [Micrococcales bacterium]NBT47030.1 type I methionyl aminopeptidase [Actinomycetota bacterium]NBY44109.1 type I methionyl aminopeptidase [Micrococcales bacterium]
MPRERISLKTNAEIMLMREAGLITAAALAEVRKAIKPGVSTLELDAIAEKTIISHGAKSNFKLVPGYSHTICVSINDEVVHGIPKADRIIQAGDIVSVDCGAQTPNGWNADAAFSVVVPGGDPEVVQRREALSKVCEDSLWAGIAKLASATRLNEVGRAVEGSIRASGRYGILQDYIGHGVGRSMHEDPAVFNYQTRDLGPVIENGLVIAIEPMITQGSQAVRILADNWTVSTKDGADGAHWEHTVAKHADGVWVLTAEDGGVEGLKPYGVTPIKPKL